MEILENVPVCAGGKWLASRKISGLLGKQNGWAGRILKELKCDAGVPAKTTCDRNFMFYPPCVIAALRLIKEDVPKAPYGWLTRNEVMKCSRTDMTWRRAQALLDAFGDSGQIMRDSKNRKFRYYPPEVVAAVLGLA